MDTRRFGTSFLSTFYCSFGQIDSELVLPTMRSAVEKQLNLIALGKVYICCTCWNFEGHNPCELTGHKILILKKEQWLEETTYSTWWLAKIKLLKHFILHIISPLKISTCMASFETFNNCRQTLMLCCNMVWTYSNSSFSTSALTSLQWMSYLRQASPLWQKEESLYHGKLTLKVEPGCKHKILKINKSFLYFLIEKSLQ